MKKTDSKPKRTSLSVASRRSALAKALAAIAEDLVAAGLGSVNLGQLAEHMLKEVPNNDVKPGMTFIHPDLGISFEVESVKGGLALMRRYEMVGVERLLAGWKRHTEMDCVERRPAAEPQESGDA